MRSSLDVHHLREFGAFIDEDGDVQLWLYDHVRPMKVWIDRDMVAQMVSALLWALHQARPSEDYIYGSSDDE